MSSPLPETAPAQMPSRNFILFTTPVPISSLDDDSKLCPICTEPYVEFEPNSYTSSMVSTSRPDTADSNDFIPECAVKVHLSASSEGKSKLCGHIFGRHCLEQHLNSKGDFRNRCPLCRNVWFETTRNSFQAARDSSPSSSQNLPRPRLSTLLSSSRLRIRNFLRGYTFSESSYASGSVSGSERGDSMLSSRSRLQRSAGFVQQVLNTFEIRDAGREIDVSVSEVEGALDRLYQMLEGPVEERRRDGDSDERS
jgi:hypothetical protein